MSVSATMSLALGSTEPSERLSGLADRLCALLSSRGPTLDVGQIVQQVLRIKGAPERLQRLLVAEIVDADVRLGWRARDLVGLQSPSWSTATLHEANFCVVDLETTGGRPGSAKITEIGAVRVTGLELTDRFQQLVDPQVEIPSQITALTGIDQALVAGQPRIPEALERFVDFARGDVLVAHNAPFDLGFLNYERQRLGGSHFLQPALDTLSLARRLLRGELTRFDLGSLATWAMTSVRPSHRALPDAEATAEILLMLLSILAERGERTVADALRYSRPYSNKNAHKLALAEDLPSAPGVYMMRARNGDLLYVGKAANLRRRVRSYFGPNGRHAAGFGGVLDRLAAIDHQVCGSEFEAAIEEGRLLAELRPPGNRQGASQHARRYLKLTVRDGYPRLFVVARPKPDGARYFGPLLSGKRAALTLEALHCIFPLRSCHPICRPGSPRGHRFEADCGGSCAGVAPAAYREVTDRLERSLSGDASGMAELAGAIHEAASSGRLDPVGRDRDRIAALLSSLARLARLGRVADCNAIVVEPGPDGDPVGFFIGRGLVVHQAPLHVQDTVEAGIRAIRAAPLFAHPGAVEESSIVHAHLALRAESAVLLSLPRTWQDQEARQWLATAAQPAGVAAA